MKKQLVRTLVGVVLVASTLAFISTEAAAHNPSCGDHPNTNKGFAINSRQSLTGEQVGNARLIMGIAEERDLPRQAAEIAITAALQASSLLNSHSNNRGLFQQLSPYYPGVDASSPRSATNAFFDRLVGVPRWKTGSIAGAASTVQGTRTSKAFTSNAPIATALADRWWGSSDNPTSCSTNSSSSASGSESSSNSSSDSSSQRSGEQQGTQTGQSDQAGQSTQTGQGDQAGQSNSATSPTTRRQAQTTQRPPTTKRSTTQRSTTQRSTTQRVTSSPKVVPVAGTNRVKVGRIVVNRSIGTDLQGLITAANRQGLSLTGVGYRESTRQIQLRRQNCGTSTYSVYQKSPSLCSPPTARPGTSNHEKGLAVDFRNCSTRTTRCYKWLKENASDYGLFNLPSEPWHWSVNGR